MFQQIQIIFPLFIFENVLHFYLSRLILVSIIPKQYKMVL